VLSTQECHPHRIVPAAGERIWAFAACLCPFCTLLAVFLAVMAERQQQQPQLTLGNLLLGEGSSNQHAVNTHCWNFLWLAAHPLWDLVLGQNNEAWWHSSRENENIRVSVIPTSIPCNQKSS